MYAVVVRVSIGDRERAEQGLREHVIPAVRQIPGFVAGYWLAPEGNQGMSIVLFESEDAARTAAQNIRPPQAVTIESVEVREVVAST